MTWSKNQERDVMIIRAVLGGAVQAEVARGCGISPTRVYQIMCKYERRCKTMEARNRNGMNEHYMIMDDNFNIVER